MAEQPTRKLAVILHADVVGSTTLVQQDEALAHARIQDAFRRFSLTIEAYSGMTHELRGDALVAEFARASDAVAGGLAFQVENTESNARLEDDLQPQLRIGISLGEVVIADSTVTGAGVVLAQRVEQLAEPGGVCITGAVHEAVPQYLPLDYSDLGKREVKGFEEPVQVYSASVKTGEQIPPPEPGVSVGAQSRKPNHLRSASMIALLVLVVGAIAWWQPWKPELEPASVERMKFELPDMPSIAVLPLNNMSEDASQDFFADGMTEDLITDLSKISGLFVIARNSSFSYKGQQVKVRQVAEELGVRYVLEGSVRRVEDQVRINAQLIDATTGGHIWAERYDGSLTDVFGLQDKVVRQIVSALAVNLVTTESAQAGKSETGDPAAYDAVLQGWEFVRNRSPEDYAKAISFFEKAVELDPGYSRAYAGLATVYWKLHDLGWESQLGMSYQALDLARENLAKALTQPTADAYRISAEIQVALGEKTEALREIDRAVALAPNDANNLRTRAWILIVSGRAKEAEDDARRAVRLDPANPLHIRTLARALFHQERYEEAIEKFEHAASVLSNYEHIYTQLAMTYGYLGRIEEAIAAVEKRNTLARSAPNLTLQTYESWMADQYDYDRTYLHQLVEGLRLAGVPAGTTAESADVNYKDLVTKSAGTFDVEGAIEIDAAGAKILFDRGAVFIDSRGSNPYDRGYIPGATNLNYGWQLTRDSLSQLVGQDDEVVFYCGGLDCHLSANSSAQALTWGYTKVYYFAGGYPAWKDAGYPVETP